MAGDADGCAAGITDGVGADLGAGVGAAVRADAGGAGFLIWAGIGVVGWAGVGAAGWAGIGVVGWAGIGVVGWAAGFGRGPAPGRKTTVLSLSGSTLTYVSSRRTNAPLLLVFAQTVVLYHPFQRKAVIRVGGVSPRQRVGECLGIGRQFHCVLISRASRQQPAVLIKCLRQ